MISATYEYNVLRCKIIGYFASVKPSRFEKYIIYTSSLHSNTNGLVAAKIKLLHTTTEAEKLTALYKYQ